MSKETAPEPMQGPRTFITAHDATELDTLIRAALAARFAFGDIGARYGTRSQEAQEAEKVDDEAYAALVRWQLAHGLVV